MKKVTYFAVILITVLFCACNTFVSPQTDTTELWPAGKYIEETNSILYGYINRKGEFVIKPQYRYATTFSCGYAIVTDDNNKYYYINKYGTKLFSSEEDIEPFYYGYAIYRDGRETGFLNTLFNIARQADRHVYGNMSKDGLIPYSSEDGYCYLRVNKTTKTIEKNKKDTARFDYAGVFIDGYAIVKTEYGYGIINTELDFTMKPKGEAYELQNLGHGLFIKSYLENNTNSHSNCFIDPKGIILTEINNNISRVRSFTEEENLTAFYDESTGKYGFIDTKGNIAIEPQYDDYLNFSEGYAVVVSSDGLEKIINKQNTVVFTLKEEEESMTYMHNGLILTTTHGEDRAIFSYRDTKGDVIYSWEGEPYPALPCAPRRFSNADGRPVKHYAIGGCGD